MMIRPTAAELATHEPEYTVLHTPYLLADPDTVDGLDSNAFILLSLKHKLVLIGGTQYAGEIKKSLFSIMNYLLPATGQLPMHCSCNTTGNNTAVFFGLSGTGKTTLSADPNRRLVGDDEHGWTDKGIFNFEGGCYAKLINLKEEDEPAIYATTRMPGTIMENVILGPDGSPDFTDDSLTANTRGAYPIEYIENREPSGTAGHPQNIVFLTCDAFGVLPPIARLTPEQAAYHFISGYTAKVAGTEMNIDTPTATFSTCFGAPFMPRHPGASKPMLATQHWLDRRRLRPKRPHQNPVDPRPLKRRPRRPTRRCRLPNRPPLRLPNPPNVPRRPKQNPKPPRNLARPRRLRPPSQPTRHHVPGKFHSIRGRHPRAHP
jgi:phosphoenolpyruvate carboxykinase (ATP)